MKNAGWQVSRRYGSGCLDYVWVRFDAQNWVCIGGEHVLTARTIKKMVGDQIATVFLLSDLEYRPTVSSPRHDKYLAGTVIFRKE